jgi:aminoglycoside phosphotransferase
MALEFAGLVDFLNATDSRSAAYGKWSVRRAGRNRVWRAQAPDFTVYVKLADGAKYYARERYGLDISQQLAAQDERIAAPSVLYTNDAIGAIVASAVQGVRLDDLLKAGFRIDHNPLRSDRPMQAFVNSVAQARHWLEALHSLPVARKEILFDHTCAHMRDRILTKLQRAVEARLLYLEPQVLRGFGSMEVQALDSVERLICGDASLGNFLWDGERISRVDFEDLGFGAPARDYAEIRAGFQSTDQRFWYWSLRRALAALPPASGQTEETMYRLEWALDRHWPGPNTKPTEQTRRLTPQIESMVKSLVPG